MEKTIPTTHAEVAVSDSASDGPPVLFLHGNSVSKEVFRNQTTNDLARRWRIVAMDLPGHGASGNAKEPERSYTVPGYADAAREVLDQLEIERAAVVGISLGGHVGIEMMARSLGVSGLFITGSPAVSPGMEGFAQAFQPMELAPLLGQAELTDEEAAKFVGATLGESHSEEFLPAVLRTDHAARPALFGALMQGEGANQREAVETSEIPLAVVNGALDQFVNHEYVGSLQYANLWRGCVHSLAGLGHAPFLESPATYNALLAEFLEDVWA
ncbi:MAG: alpha/beta hydrolase [bacterium]